MCEHSLPRSTGCSVAEREPDPELAREPEGTPNLEPERVGNRREGRTPSVPWQPCAPAIPLTPAVRPTVGVRPIEASKAAIRNGCFTSTLPVG